MAFLKLTPKVPAALKAPIPPRAITRPQKVKSVRSLDGLSEEEIEKALEKEYIQRGALLLKFLPTGVANFKLSIDGRFGIRHHSKLKFFQLFIFREKKKLEEFVGKSYEDIKWWGEQTHFYYNERQTTADMQMRALAAKVAKYLGAELEITIQKARQEWFALEDAENARKLQTAVMREELDESHILYSQGSEAESAPENGKSNGETSTPIQGDFAFEEKSAEVACVETPRAKNDFGIPLNI